MEAVCPGHCDAIFLMGGCGSVSFFKTVAVSNGLQCIKMYNTDWQVITYKYEAYSGDFRMLPR